MRIKGLFAAAIIAAAFFMTGTLYAAEIDPVERSLYPDTGFKVTYKGIKYVKPNGEFLKDSWLLIGQQAWCFDGDGLMATGVRVVNGLEWNLSYEGKAAPLNALQAAPGQTKAASPAAGSPKAPETAKAPATNSVKAPETPGAASAPALSPSAKAPEAEAAKTGASANTLPAAPDTAVSSNTAAAAP